MRRALRDQAACTSPPSTQKQASRFPSGRLRPSNISPLSFSNTRTARGLSISRSIRLTGTTRLTTPSSTRSSRNSTTESEATSWSAPRVKPGIPFITRGRTATVSPQSSTTLQKKILRLCERISRNIQVRFRDVWRISGEYSANSQYFASSRTAYVHVEFQLSDYPTYRDLSPNGLEKRVRPRAPLTTSCITIFSCKYTTRGGIFSIGEWHGRTLYT